MSDLGTRLKQAREARGMSLNELATATKISPGALEALERNEYTRLPGGIFSRSFVRAYAIAVGLDPEATVNEFLVELNKSEREAERLARERRPEISQDDREFLERQRRAVRWLRVVLLVIAIVALSLLVYQGWQWWQGRNAAPTSSVRPSGPIAASLPIRLASATARPCRRRRARALPRSAAI